MAHRGESTDSQEWTVPDGMVHRGESTECREWANPSESEIHNQDSRERAHLLDSADRRDPDTVVDRRPIPEDNGILGSTDVLRRGFGSPVSPDKKGLLPGPVDTDGHSSGPPGHHFDMKETLVTTLDSRSHNCQPPSSLDRMYPQLLDNNQEGSRECDQDVLLKNSMARMVHERGLNMSQDQGWETVHERDYKTVQKCGQEIVREHGQYVHKRCQEKVLDPSQERVLGSLFEGKNDVDDVVEQDVGHIGEQGQAVGHDYNGQRPDQFRGRGLSPDNDGRRGSQHDIRSEGLHNGLVTGQHHGQIRGQVDGREEGEHDGQHHVRNGDHHGGREAGHHHDCPEAGQRDCPDEGQHDGQAAERRGRSHSPPFTWQSSR
jgi:hypothetical protein